MLEELVDPLRRHLQAPLPVLEVLLPRVAPRAGLFDHALDLIWMERVEHLEEEVPLWELVVPVGQVMKDVGPLMDLRVDVLHGQPGPVRHRLCRNLRLPQALLLAVQDGLQEDELALGRLRQEVATYKQISEDETSADDEDKE